jgi:hypothetical protein
MESGSVAVLVPDYGNGWHATEFHRFSYYPGFLLLIHFNGFPGTLAPETL